VDRPTAKKIRALHVVAGIEPIDGGPSYSVPGLCRSLVSSGADVTALSVMRGNEPPQTRHRGFVDLRFPVYPGPLPLLKRLRFSRGLTGKLNAEAGQFDVIHNHGLWLLPNLQAAWAAQREKIPFIITPRGMLSPVALGFSAAKKKLFWSLLQGAAAKTAACIHVTSMEEYGDARACGLANPISIIPNGIDVPESAPAKGKQGHARVALSLGRIHPKKGLDRLIRAWAHIEMDRPAWRLRIVGPPELNHDEELRALARSLGLQRVSIEGPLYENDKLTAFREADLFILPTLSENFAMTVAEALAANVPVIATKGAPWAALESEQCGWWIDHGVEPMIETLRRATELTAQ
jgi:glycosyltransferase involved in cell wall biosynthesis